MVSNGIVHEAILPNFEKKLASWVVVTRCDTFETNTRRESGDLGGLPAELPRLSSSREVHDTRPSLPLSSAKERNLF